MRRMATIAVAVLAVLGIGWCGYTVYAHGKFDENGARIRTIAALLESKPQALRSLAAQTPFRDLDDAWGRPLTIRTWKEKDAFHYRIESLGSDGRRGPCCVGVNACKSPQCDWIIEDDRYVAW